MRRLDRGTTGSALVALLLACAGLAALAAAPASAARGCPQAALKPQPAPRNVAHPPAHEVVACVGTTPITGAQLAHWAAIARHQLEEHPVEAVAFEALDTLAGIAASEAEAHEHHLVVTAKAVRRSFEHDLRTRFRRPGSLQRFLKANGEHTADYLVELRQQLLSAALERHESAAEQNLFQDKWKARTTCARGIGDGILCGLIAPSGRGLPAVGAPLDPSQIVVDPVSDTIYVLAANELMLIDGRTCNASTTSGCARARTILLAGTSPSAITVDPATETIYLSVTERPAAIDVLDARACNATTISGCSHLTAQVRLGAGLVPDRSIVDPSTHTLYVRDQDRSGTISVLDIRACNATDHSGCAKPPARLRTDDGLPSNTVFNGTLAVNPATSTLYVANDAGRAQTVSLVDTRACSALDASGCAARWPRLNLPGPPLTLGLDASTGALYVSLIPGKVAVIDGATCNGTVRSGCGRQRILRLREAPSAIALDGPTHTAYMATTVLGGAELLDTAACNATASGGCQHAPRLAPTGGDPGDVAIDERTRTVFVANGTDESVSLIAADRCNATTAAGC